MKHRRTTQTLYGRYDTEGLATISSVLMLFFVLFVSSVFTQLPHDFLVVYADVDGQIIIGGVILKLFIQQPSWVEIHVVCMYKALTVVLFEGFEETKGICCGSDGSI